MDNLNNDEALTAKNKQEVYLCSFYHIYKEANSLRCTLYSVRNLSSAALKLDIKEDLKMCSRSTQTQKYITLY